MSALNKLINAFLSHLGLLRKAPDAGPGKNTPYFPPNPSTVFVRPNGAQQPPPAPSPSPTGEEVCAFG